MQRIVFVHGFTQTRRSWDPIISRLAPRWEFVPVDLPGHGESRATGATDLREAAAILGEAGGAGVYVGYSMGGRIALQLAVTNPEVVKALVLISVTAGIEDDAARAARFASDEELAGEIERTPVREFLEKWLSQPMFAGLPSGEIDNRLSNTSSGLASALRSMGAGAMKLHWSDLSRLEMPVLLVTGELDQKFTAIAARMQSTISNAIRETLPGAGHAAHLERPKEFARILEEFLSSDPKPPSEMNPEDHMKPGRSA